MDQSCGNMENCNVETAAGRKSLHRGIAEVIKDSIKQKQATHVIFWPRIWPYSVYVLSI